jgi:hypothetical protein
LVEQDFVSDSYIKAPNADNFICPVLPSGKETPLYLLVFGNNYASYTIGKTH